MLIITSCTVNETDNKAVTIAGSTSVQPFMEILAERFMEINPDILVNVQGGGSTAGIVAADEGIAELGMSSRNLKEGEKHLDSFILAKDGLAIVVNPENKIRSLSLEEIRDIFSGGIRNWREVGGPDKEINVIVREDGSGTRGAFEELVMKEHLILPEALVQDSNGAVREMVSNDIYSIGFISLGLVNKEVYAVSIDSIEPDFENIISGKYTLVRPFLIVHRGKLEHNTEKFVEFLASDEAQQILKREGLIPLK